MDEDAAKAALIDEFKNSLIDALITGNTENIPGKKTDAYNYALKGYVDPKDDPTDGPPVGTIHPSVLAEITKSIEAAVKHQKYDVVNKLVSYPYIPTNTEKINTWNAKTRQDLIRRIFQIIVDKNDNLMMLIIGKSQLLRGGKKRGGKKRGGKKRDADTATAINDVFGIKNPDVVRPTETRGVVEIIRKMFVDALTQQNASMANAIWDTMEHHIIAGGMDTVQAVSANDMRDLMLKWDEQEILVSGMNLEERPKIDKINIAVVSTQNEIIQTNERMIRKKTMAIEKAKLSVAKKKADLETVEKKRTLQFELLQLRQPGDDKLTAFNDQTTEMLAKKIESIEKAEKHLEDITAKHTRLIVDHMKKIEDAKSIISRFPNMNDMIARDQNELSELQRTLTESSDDIIAAVNNLRWDSYLTRIKFRIRSGTIDELAPLFVDPITKEFPHIFTDEYTDVIFGERTSMAKEIARELASFDDSDESTLMKTYIKEIFPVVTTDEYSHVIEDENGVNRMILAIKDAVATNDTYPIEETKTIRIDQDYTVYTKSLTGLPLFFDDHSGTPYPDVLGVTMLAISHLAKAASTENTYELLDMLTKPPFIPIAEYYNDVLGDDWDRTARPNLVDELLDIAIENDDQKLTHIIGESSLLYIDQQDPNPVDIVTSRVWRKLIVAIKKEKVNVVDGMIVYMINHLSGSDTDAQTGEPVSPMDNAIDALDGMRDAMKMKYLPIFTWMVENPGSIPFEIAINIKTQDEDEFNPKGKRGRDNDDGRDQPPKIMRIKACANGTCAEPAIYATVEKGSEKRHYCSESCAIADFDRSNAKRRAQRSCDRNPCTKTAIFVTADTRHAKRKYCSKSCQYADIDSM